MEITEIHRIFRTCRGVSTDSRSIRSGALYIALKGEHFDGNDFVLQALDSGASFAITDRTEFSGNDRCIVVPDSLATLQELARYHRAQFKIPVLGITGTNGKTTTKELLAAVLSTQFITHSTKGNLNNHIGVPLTLLELNSETEFAVIEMGANHPGEIAGLCELAMPNLGIITNIGKAHLEGFGSQENIIQTKNALYTAVGSGEGILFVNGSNPLLMKLSEKYTRILYGNGASYNYNGVVDPESAVLAFHFRHQGRDYPVQTRLAGAYNFENAMAAVAVGLHFEIHPSNIKTALENYTPGNNRSQILTTDHNQVILDAYNANPSSMETAIRNFHKMNAAEAVLILGDMLELGDTEEKEHQSVVQLIDDLAFREVYLIGPVFSRITEKGKNYLRFDTVENARDFFLRNPLKGKHILIKGSRGIHLERLNETL